MTLGLKHLETSRLYSNQVPQSSISTPDDCSKYHTTEISPPLFPHASLRHTGDMDLSRTRTLLHICDVGPTNAIPARFWSLKSLIDLRIQIKYSRPWLANDDHDQLSRSCAIRRAKLLTYFKDKIRHNAAALYRLVVFPFLVDLHKLNYSAFMQSLVDGWWRKQKIKYPRPPLISRLFVCLSRGGLKAWLDIFPVLFSSTCSSLHLYWNIEPVPVNGNILWSCSVWHPCGSPSSVS
jgi:hypothetical protein